MANGNSGDISVVTSGGNIEIIAGTLTESTATDENGRIYALLGHGGYDSDVFGNNTYVAGPGHRGDIRVNATTGSVRVVGGDNRK